VAVVLRGGKVMNKLPQYTFPGEFHSKVDIHGASKKFREWYQEKKEDTNKLTILAVKMILILHNTLLATFIKASGKCVRYGLFRSRSQNPAFFQTVR
jgi:hypothetical protein